MSLVRVTITSFPPTDQDPESRSRPFSAPRARFFSLGRNADLDYYLTGRCGESGELTLSFSLSPLSFWKWDGSRGHFEGGGYFAHKHESRARTRYLSDTNTSFLPHPDHRAPRTVLVISPAIFGVLNCAELCSSFML